MPYLSSYKLENICYKNGKLFAILEAISIILKVAALLLLIILFHYFYIGIAVWMLSIVPNFFKHGLLYKYVYCISDGILTVNKEFNIQNSKELYRIDIKKDIESVSFIESGVKLYESITDMPVCIELKSGEMITLSADTYFYALIDYYRRQNDFFR